MTRNKRTPARPRAPKGTPTSLNLWVLARHFGGKPTAPNRIEATSVPHLRRCLKAGLVTVKGPDLVLTPAGVEAVSGVAL